MVHFLAAIVLTTFPCLIVKHFTGSRIDGLIVGLACSLLYGVVVGAYILGHENGSESVTTPRSELNITVTHRFHDD